jgi:hypothetical protein
MNNQPKAKCKFDLEYPIFKMMGISVITNRWAMGCGSSDGRMGGVFTMPTFLRGKFYFCLEEVNAPSPKGEGF